MIHNCLLRRCGRTEHGRTEVALGRASLHDERKTPMCSPRLPPHLGEHATRFYESSGFDQAAIEALHAQGVLGAAPVVKAAE